MSDQLKAELALAKKTLKAIEAHRARIKGLTPDRWLDARHHASVLEVNRLTARVAAIRSGFAGRFS